MANNHFLMLIFMTLADISSAQEQLFMEDRIPRPAFGVSIPMPCSLKGIYEAGMRI